MTLREKAIEALMMERKNIDVALGILQGDGPRRGRPPKAIPGLETEFVADMPKKRGRPFGSKNKSKK